MQTQITNYIRAGYPGLYLVSAEEARIEVLMKQIAQSLDYQLYWWSVTEGLVNTKDGSGREVLDPISFLTAMDELPEKTLVLLKDFHLFLEDNNPVLTRKLKNSLRLAKTKGKVLLVVGCRQVLPPELERELVVVPFALPDKEQLGVVLDNIATSARLPKPENDEREPLLDAACGLTSIEAENAYALSVVEMGKLCCTTVAREKANEVKKGGLLEVCSTVASLDDIGGLDCLKAWLLQRRDAFGKEARAFGLPSPKGLLSAQLAAGIRCQTLRLLLHRAGGELSQPAHHRGGSVRPAGGAKGHRPISRHAIPNTRCRRHFTSSPGSWIPRRNTRWAVWTKRCPSDRSHRAMPI